MNTDSRQTIKVIPNTMSSSNPNPVVKDGDVYVFNQPMNTRAGHVHQKNSIIFVLKSTTETPHNEISASGNNWICSTKFGIGCWATLESCISRGVLDKKV